MPLEGNVCINVLAGGTEARVARPAMRICEALPRQGKGWYLVFRDGIPAAVDACDDVARVPLGEIVKGKKLWRVADNELFFENTWTEIVTFLWDQWARYARADVEITGGEVKRLWKATCFVTGWFRHGSLAEFAVLAEASARKREEDIDSCRCLSACCFAEVKHCVVFTRRDTAGCSEVHRVVAPTDYDGSAVSAKKITLVLVVEHVGDKRFYAALNVFATRVASVALFDWENVYGYWMSWLSWAWRVLHFPVAHKLWPRVVRLFPEHDREEPLTFIAARSGFWSVQLRFLRGLAEMLGAEFAESQWLVEVLQALTLHVLKCYREEALTQMALRLRWGASATDSLKGILAECEDGADCWLKADAQVLQHEQREAASGAGSHDEQFVHELVGASIKARESQVATDVPAVGGRGRARAKGHAAQAPSKVKVTKDLCVVMDQKEAKGYTPPGTGSCLWRSSADSAWHCRLGVDRTREDGSEADCFALGALCAWED